jgi:hypothetical protein
MSSLFECQKNRQFHEHLTGVRFHVGAAKLANNAPMSDFDVLRFENNLQFLNGVHFHGTVTAIEGLRDGIEPKRNIYP